jgi:hypothetical protein
MKGCIMLLLLAGVMLASESKQPEAPRPATILECYDGAVARLEKICNDYRRIKAIELAQTSGLAFADAYENIQSVMPILKEIDRGLLRRAIVDPKLVVPHKHEVEKVESEVLMMVELAAKLLEEIEKVEVRIISMPPPTPEQQKTLEEIVQQETYDPTEILEITAEVRQQQQTPELQELEEMAKEQPEERAKDLTEVMKQVMRQRPDIEDLTQDQTTADELDLQLFRSGNDPGELMGPIDVAQVNHNMGRRVQDERGSPVEWMFVDTWYTIGPFPNPGRVNIHKKFPPESVVDLGAEYPGKNGKLVAWHFQQSNAVQCVPKNDEQYAIYYAYTEVYCDRPMDLWIAVGSDDKANVWLNDMPVWISGDQLKGWRVNEGFRKVSFQAGVNRVLYRVENGWMGTAFSLGIRVAP